MNPSEVRVSLYDRLAMLITEDTKKSIRREAINVQFIPLVYLPTTPNLMLVACLCFATIVPPAWNPVKAKFFPQSS